ncbi:MAG: hypothetical protein KAK01_00505, partial [Candidatus Marinimicrobia bacterium]|nr:hypothetical protein [Candidatus Neomarinimicrobiota bacterium]
LNQSIAAGTGSILNVRFNIHPTAYASDVVIDMVDAAITDDLGGLYWIAGITPGIIAVYPGYLEPPTNLIATSGLDGHVPLTWAPPNWDIPEDTIRQGFEGAEFPPEDWAQVQINTIESGPTPEFWSPTDGTAGRVYSHETDAHKMVFDDSCIKDEAGLANRNYESESNTQVVIRNSSRTTRDLTGYNMHRSLTSPVEVIPVNLVTSVPYTQLTYDDDDVTNGLSYFYAVTADYGAMGESGPSNEDIGVPLEWVELEISSGSTLTGQTDTLDIFLNNESDVCQFSIEIADVPDYLIALEVLPTSRINGFTIDVLEYSDGNAVIDGFSIGKVITPGSDPICQLVVRANAPEPGTVDLNIVTAEIRDAMNNVMP